MKKKKIAVITGIVAAVVILGGIATYVYVFKNNHSAPEIKDGVTDTQSSWNTDTHHIAAEMEDIIIHNMMQTER